MMVNAVNEFLDDLRGGKMEDAPVVTVSQGQLQGRVVSGASGKAYYSFQGIPYAKPPLGSLRFKAPEPAEPWEGIRDATTEGNFCAQHDHMNNGEFIGDENCLFLNVYTPNLDGEFLPVMVYIHGGAYRIGSGSPSSTGPDYIVDKDVVVVTLNYRVGPLGFLCLNTPEVPGNAGLKDVVAALRWVKENIHHFGGNSGNITLFGESAGAAAVTLFTASPMSKDLISKAISMSGSPLNPWAFQTKPLESARRLAEHLGCESSDYDVILDFLRATSAKDLVEATQKLDPFEQLLDDCSNIFAVVVEKEFPGVEAVLTEPFVDLLTTGRIADVPVLVGTTGLEFCAEPKTDDFRSLIPKEFNLDKDSEDAVALAERVKKFYIAGGHLNVENWHGFFKLLSDVAISVGVHRYVRHLTKVATKPVYVYKFDYDGGLNISNKLHKSFGLNHAGHTDVRAYLFKTNAHDGIEPSPQDVKTRERIVRLFTNFAKSGNPTPEENHYITVTWLPVTKDTIYYLSITNELALQTEPDRERMEFWDELYNQYYKIWEQPRSNVSHVPAKETVTEVVSAEVVEEINVEESIQLEENKQAEESKPDEINSVEDSKPSEEPEPVEETKPAEEPTPIEEEKTIEQTVVIDETVVEIVEKAEPIENVVKANGNHANGTVNGISKTSNEIKMVTTSNGTPKDVIRANDPPEDDLPKNIGVNKFVNFFESLGGKKK